MLAFGCVTESLDTLSSEYRHEFFRPVGSETEVAQPRFSDATLSPVTLTESPEVLHVTRKYLAPGSVLSTLRSRESNVVHECHVLLFRLAGTSAKS